jgi:hypothetical protein
MLGFLNDSLVQVSYSGEPLTRTTVDLFALSSAGAGPVTHCSPD